MQMQMRTSSLRLNATKATNLSVIVTTSPVPSNPSTEMLDRVLASLLVERKQVTLIYDIYIYIYIYT